MDFLKLRKELVDLQDRISHISSTREQRDKLGVWLGKFAAPRLVFLGIEWVGVLSSWWLGVIIMLADYVITEYFSRNDLQNWFEQGIFGNENNQNSEGLKPEAMAKLIGDSRNSLIASLRAMSSPQHKKEQSRKIMYWPFNIMAESDDYEA